jgi:hypothetical protein
MIKNLQKAEKISIDFNLNENAKKVVIFIGSAIVIIALFMLISSLKPKD